VESEWGRSILNLDRGTVDVCGCNNDKPRIHPCLESKGSLVQVFHTVNVASEGNHVVIPGAGLAVSVGVLNREALRTGVVYQECEHREFPLVDSSPYQRRHEAGMQDTLLLFPLTADSDDQRCVA
jgi:hypothetical protein